LYIFHFTFNFPFNFQPFFFFTLDFLKVTARNAYTSTQMFFLQNSGPLPSIPEVNSKWHASLPYRYQPFSTIATSMFRHTISRFTATTAKNVSGIGRVSFWIDFRWLKLASKFAISRLQIHNGKKGWEQKHKSGEKYLLLNWQRPFSPDSYIRSPPLSFIAGHHSSIDTRKVVSIPQSIE
jgi:hypothetical protein